MEVAVRSFVLELFDLMLGLNSDPTLHNNTLIESVIYSRDGEKCIHVSISTLCFEYYFYSEFVQTLSCGSKT